MKDLQISIFKAKCTIFHFMNVFHANESQYVSTFYLWQFNFAQNINLQEETDHP